jgi:Kae1-associated kinase Bud32
VHMGKILSKGAEGYVSQVVFLGAPAVVKERRSKRYRISQIDSYLRNSRTLSEARLLCAAKQAGVLCPLVLFVDTQRMRIFEQKLDGKLLSCSSNRVRARSAKAAGELLGRLHSAGIYHGDYTTTNLMLCRNGLYVIDFGLSESSMRIEDYATDLLLYKKSVPAAEFSDFLSGYRKANPRNAAAAIRQLGDIEGRGRYVAKNQ